MNWELTMNGLGVNYESWMNIYTNELHSSCESAVRHNTWHYRMCQGCTLVAKKLLFECYIYLSCNVILTLY
jgi:hypothetical protein